jgi:N-6 DNA methylase
MELVELIEQLGYRDSRNYLKQDEGHFNHVVDYGHLFRKAADKRCNLKGVYTLRDSECASIPIIYVCEAQTEAEAKEVHRLIWNQDTVPFLIVNSPDTVRVYPGFCQERSRGKNRSITTVLETFNTTDFSRITNTLQADAVDTGLTWREWGRHILPEHRVDSRLLENLRKLDSWQQEIGELSRDVSHALIGKYVYLHYLRDRDILSDKKLENWNIPAEVVFGRNATVDGLQSLIEKLDEWLNGEVFPIDFSRRGAPRDKHIAHVAATFNGDEPLGGGQLQLHLDFKAYDFSYIPIEVLSIVYEQFLHQGSDNQGRSAGAYYTPIPVVNLMLSELEEKRPLKRGMRVCDFSCGSGAFLVQAFRRLIEKEFPPEEVKHPNPIELRELVKEHFFGVDTDSDACGVTKLSLILTLLDYVHPPDLENNKPGRKPKLPDLKDNIFCGNFFDDEAEWNQIFTRKKADWIVGNPPWKKLTSSNMREEDKPVLAWINQEKKQRPVGNQQAARAFAWRVAEFVAEDGEIGMFLPAMSLFEEAVKDFRSSFFQSMQVHTIINFSNLRWIISAGRFTAPAAAFFYRPRIDNRAGEEIIRTFSPLVANQEATRSVINGKHNECWSIVFNASEFKDIPLYRVIEGDGLPWKLGAWGSDLDARLLGYVQKRFKTISDMEANNLIIASEGLQLRKLEDEKNEDIEPVRGISKALILDMQKVRGLRDFFVFPNQAIQTRPKELKYVRKGRLELPLRISHPPHIIVSEARNFAIYSDEYIIVPPRQIGIISTTGDQELLKALSIYLSSDFAFFFEYFNSTKLGVERGVSTLKTMRRMPTPLFSISRKELKEWIRLHDRLAKASRDSFHKGYLWKDAHSQAAPKPGPVVDQELFDELNSLVYKALGLKKQDRALVQDFVQVRLGLNDGGLDKEAIDPPTKIELKNYGRRLRDELDSFIAGEIPGRHVVEILYDEYSGMVRINLNRKSSGKKEMFVVKAGDSESNHLQKCREHVRQQRSQWVYFDRNFRAYDKTYIYVLKPMQRFHWTQTQARIDAREIISESIARGRSS